MEVFCNERGILQQFSYLYVPQMNAVVERKNRTLIEGVRTMLADSMLPLQFGNEVIVNACHTLNRVLLVMRHGKSCFELLHKRKPNLEDLEPFGAPCTLLKRTANSKFDEKAVVGYFLAYNVTKKRLFNKFCRLVEHPFLQSC